MKRDEILITYNDLLKKRNDLFTVIYENESKESIKALAELNEKIADTNMAYLNTLSTRTISRCPFTAELVNYKMDTLGFGPWWRDENPMREKVEGPKTFFALDGSMRVENVDEFGDWTIFPGPDKPFIIPEVLNHSSIKAVISETYVAGNKTWLVTYFSFPIALIDRPNLYASDRYYIELATGDEVAYGSSYTEKNYDYDLASWVKRGKLLWIEPGDTTYRLQSTLNGCPFLSIDGKGQLQMIQNGKRTYYSTLGERSIENE